MKADRIAAGRLVVPDKSLGLQCPQNVVRGTAMEPGSAGDLAGIQRPLRVMQDTQHFCRRDDRTHWLARIAPAEIAGIESLLHRAGWLCVAPLCLEGAGSCLR